MKDQIDVAVRRSPKYSVFMGIGAVLGVFVASILAMFVDPADMPMGYTVAKGVGLMLLVLGTGGLFLGGLLALILDWTGRKRAKEFRVDAQIDMVDDPKEVARRRLAEARGEDPEVGEETGASTVTDGAVTEGAVADEALVEGAETVEGADGGVEDATGTGDDISEDGGTGRGSSPDSTV